MRKVLIVDDEADVLNALSSSLERQKDLEVYVARDGEEALKILETSTPDIVVLDLVMPKIGGEQVLRWMRRRDRTVSTPVIISTARRETSSLISLMNAGATDYIMKPYDVQELIRVIDIYV